MPRRKAAEEVAETKEIVAAEPAEKKKRGRKELSMPRTPQDIRLFTHVHTVNFYPVFIEVFHHVVYRKIVFFLFAERKVGIGNYIFM